MRNFTKESIKIIFYLICCATIGTITGCQQEEGQRNINTADKVDIRAQSIPFTRADINAENREAVAMPFRGDTIYIYHGKGDDINCRTCTKDAGKWIVPLPPSAFEDNSPYTAYAGSVLQFNTEGIATYEVPVNQEQEKAFDKASILTAVPETAETTIHLTFRHLMSKITIIPQVEDGVVTTPPSICANSRSLIHLGGRAASDTISPHQQWFTMHKEGNSYSVIVPPQRLQNDVAGKFIKLNINGKECALSVDDLKAQGEKYAAAGQICRIYLNIGKAKTTVTERPAGSYMLTLKGGEGTEGKDTVIYALPGTEVTLPYPETLFKKLGYQAQDGYGEQDGGWMQYNAGNPYRMPSKDMVLYAQWTLVDREVLMRPSTHKGVTIYVDGVTPPKPQEWIKQNDKEEKAVVWKSGDRWYDTNQGNDPTCWMAVAANLCTWWIERNRSEVEKFIGCPLDQQTGRNKIPYRYSGTNESDIYKFIHEKLKDYRYNGGDPRQALNWFLGSSEAIKVDGGGFFKEILKNSPITDKLDGVGYYNITEFCDKALANKEAMCLTYPEAGTAHVVTVWGVQYDEKGYVKALIVSNSNDTNTSYTPQGIGGLKYYELGRKYPSNGTKDYHLYLKNSLGDYDLKVLELWKLSQGKELWKKYFDKHPEKR